MKATFLPKKSQIIFSVKMTPLIDVIFLLMIFFLLTINFHMPEGVINNQLPQLAEQNSDELSKDWETVRLRVKLVREDMRLKIYLQERVIYSYEDLLQYLNELPNDILIVIEPDDKVPYKHVIGVYNMCIKSKKKDIVFSIST
jgi:biopolymer transport protein ExbD